MSERKSQITLEDMARQLMKTPDRSVEISSRQLGNYVGWSGSAMQKLCIALELPNRWVATLTPKRTANVMLFQVPINVIVGLAQRYGRMDQPPIDEWLAEHGPLGSPESRNRKRERPSQPTAPDVLERLTIVEAAIEALQSNDVRLFKGMHGITKKFVGIVDVINRDEING